LQLAVLSDYICPFCYIGYLRLERLRQHYDLAVNWVLVEIHPDNPADGRPLSQLGYPPQHLERLLGELDELAGAEGVALSPHTFTTNSHQALLLAEASKQHGADTFYRLHRRLFESFLLEGQNIGDNRVLRTLAEDCGVPQATVEEAWHDAAYEQTLRHNLTAAVRTGATGTPTFFIGEQRLTGAVSVEALMAAAQAASASPS
jgi:predicted DsbA family dithiol-disulfide isomerase